MKESPTIFDNQEVNDDLIEKLKIPEAVMRKISDEYVSEMLFKIETEFKQSREGSPENL